MFPGLIAALDVGKTHTRLSLIDVDSGTEPWGVRRANRLLDTPIGRQLDIAGIEHWLIEALSTAPDRDRIAACVPLAHGAAAVLLDRHGDIVAAPDYEDPRFETVRDAYERERDPFSSTYSPSLPLGLNLGRQLFYLQHHEPEVFTRVTSIVPWPQFWAWRLSGNLATEVTSLGCHTDLWWPKEGRFSDLTRRRGWDALFPPRRFAGEALGLAAEPLARAAGLPAECAVSCGLHDSNASYLRFLPGRREKRFAVVSSGTWTVVMAHGASLERLSEARDMLANVDAFGSAVPTARFMGGREYEAIARTSAPGTQEALQEIFKTGALALPAFARGGPFPVSKGLCIGAEDFNETQRATLATLYVALMTDYLLELLGTEGEIIVDGPLASNALYGELLCGLRPKDPVVLSDASDSNGGVARYLAYGNTDALREAALSGAPIPGLERYRAMWRDRVMGLGPSN